MLSRSASATRSQASVYRLPADAELLEIRGGLAVRCALVTLRLLLTLTAQRERSLGSVCAFPPALNLIIEPPPHGFASDSLSASIPSLRAIKEFCEATYDNKRIAETPQIWYVEEMGLREGIAWARRVYGTSAHDTELCLSYERTGHCNSIEHIPRTLHCVRT